MTKVPVEQAEVLVREVVVVEVGLQQVVAAVHLLVLVSYFFLIKEGKVVQGQAYVGRMKVSSFLVQFNRLSFK